MAFLVKDLSFFFLVTLLSSLLIQARDSQFFNKIPSTNIKNVKNETNVVTPNKDQEPNFIPENENAYGVYGHESGQLPPSATNFEQLEKTTTPTTNLPNSKSLPKNYNPVAYVTVPENNPHEETNFNSEFTTNPTTSHYSDDNANYYNNKNNYNQYYSGDTTDEDDDHNNRGSTYDHDNGGSTYGHNNRGSTFDHNNRGSTYDHDNNNENNQYYSTSGTYNYNQYYNSVSDYNNNNNNQLKTTDYPTNTKSYPYKNGAKSYYNSQEQINPTNYRVQQQQEISDTRFLENGKYFYDVNTENNDRVPSYDDSREFRTSTNMNSNRDYYELNNYSNNFVNYEKEGEFRDEQDMP